MEVEFVLDTDRPYDSTWDMYYDEFEDLGDIEDTNDTSVTL